MEIAPPVASSLLSRYISVQTSLQGHEKRGRSYYLRVFMLHTSGPSSLLVEGVGLGKGSRSAMALGAGPLANTPPTP
jgi:hypothetical protein